MNRQVYRKKVFVIPFYNDKVMLVKDRKTKEWGFVSGGVKKNETYFQAAQRELYEETSGLMPFIPRGSREMSWKTDYRPQELLIENKKKGEKVSSNYKIFWVPISAPFAKHLEKGIQAERRSHTNQSGQVRVFQEQMDCV